MAMGAAGLQGAYAPGLNKQESSKLLTYSISTRGFYDDNIATQPDTSALKTSSFGLDVRPSVALNLTSLQQTLLSATYTYGLRYYGDRSPNADHSHQFETRLDHAFNEKHKINFENSFAYAQEPEVVGDIGVVQRSNGSAYRNQAHLEWTARLTDVLGLKTSYGNSWYDYTDTGAGSRSALLDRIEHEGRIEGTYQIQPKLTGRLGYKVDIIDYAGKFELNAPGSGIFGDSRNQTRHTGFAGADYSFNARLRGSLEAGASVATFSQDNFSSITSPYVSGNFTYLYSEDSYAQLGVSVERTATDLVGSDPAAPVTDAQSVGPYASITHKITARMKAGLLARYNNYSYSGGALDGASQGFYSGQLTFDYKLSEYITATASYNYDKSTADTAISGREFSRNRVFLGVVATY